jgi:hypothetical protein
MAVSDHTGQAWLQGFHEVGLAVFDMSADELMEIKVRVLNGPMTSIYWTMFARTPTLTGTPQSHPSQNTPLSTLPVVRNSTHTTVNRKYDTESRRSYP